MSNNPGVGRQSHAPSSSSPFFFSLASLGASAATAQHRAFIKFYDLLILIHCCVSFSVPFSAALGKKWGGGEDAPSGYNKIQVRRSDISDPSLVGKNCLSRNMISFKSPQCLIYLEHFGL